MDELTEIRTEVPERMALNPPEQIMPLGSVSALWRMSARLASSLDEQELAREAMQTAIRLTGADGGLLAFVDDTRQDWVIFHAADWDNSDLIGSHISPSESVWDRAVSNRQIVLLRGSSADRNHLPQLYSERTDVGTIMLVPIFLRVEAMYPPHALGVMCLHRRIRKPMFTAAEADLVVAHSLYVGAALQNARLIHKLTARATQFQNLIEISRTLTASLDADVVLNSITEKAVELFRCQAGSLLLRDEKTREMVFKVALGPAGAKLVGTRLPFGVGIVGAVMRDGKPLIVNDAKADPRHYSDVDKNTALLTKSLLCVPLTNGNNTFGVLELMNKIDGSLFDDEDQDILSAFALQAAIALDNARLYSDLKHAFTETIRVMTNALEARDPYTSGHTARVTQLAIETARELGWSTERLELLEIGALTHDIGKIGVPDAILNKPHGLTDDEYEQMKEHPIAGANMLMGLKTLEPLLPYILFHQERYDGSGYPFGLKADQIPIEARLIAVVDAFDAMTSTRPYRDALPAAHATAEIKKHRGDQFDPVIVDALLRVLDRQFAQEESE